MAKRKRSLGIVFIAKYEDGRDERFRVDQFTLRTDDSVARIIAREMQDGGQLPRGNIASVKRAPDDEQD